jgi:subtilase family serine protease
MDRNVRLCSKALLVSTLFGLSSLSCHGQPLGDGAAGVGAPSPGTTQTVGNPAMDPDADPMAVRPHDRLPANHDANDRVLLAGHLHPLARAEFETGRAAPEHPMEKMMLVLRPDDTQERALNALIRAQHDPSSPLFHQWLSPEVYAERFGVSVNDLSGVATWLRGHGMSVEEPTKGNRLLVFSGSTAQVEEAFQTEIHTYMVAGELHHANASDPSIPRALSEVVTGVVSLHDFQSAPAFVRQEQSEAGNTTYYNGIQESAIVPQDLATIYNVAPLYASGIDGTGQSIAILGRSNISISNVRTFRSNYGLPANDPTIIVSGKDPGIVCGGDEFESYLDVEYAGALAKKATIKFVVAASTTASDGIFLASTYAVTNKVAPIISLSYGLCEKSLGTSGNAFFNNLWQQATAQGISVLVASMDSGAAGCDAMNVPTASGGLAVNGLGSTAFNVAVGGTQFNDASNRAQYWAKTNDSVTKASALGYIPELAWNESRGSGGLYASGGGVSTLYAKPAWQFGLGVLADGKRDIPDVAFAAAIQDPYMLYADNQWFGSGGTSAATPVFASIMALVMQKNGTSLGLINQTLYNLAYKQTSSGGAAVFHDIVSGNNTVPGVTGYTTGTGHDMVTGLGSVDATQLVNHWADGASLPTFQLAAASPTASVTPGFTTTASYTVKGNNGFTSAVAFSVTGLPTGVTATFAPTSVSGSGSTTMTLSATTSATPGTYAITVKGTSGSTSQTASLSLTVVNAPSLTLTLGQSYIDIAAGSSGAAILTTTRNATFSSAVSLSAAGAPAGMTVAFSPISIATPGAGSSTITVKVGATVASAAYLLTISATGGGVTKAASLAIDVQPAPSFTLSLSPTSISVAPGASANIVATTLRISTFNSAVSLSVAGLPAGVTASTATIVAPGSGAAILQLTAGTTATGGSYTLTVTGTGGGVTKTASLALSVPNLTVKPAATAATLKLGGTTTVQVQTTVVGGFSSAVAFSVTGLPTGVTASFTPATLAAPGAGTTQMKLSATTSATIGAVPITIKATAGSVVRSQSMTLTTSK